MAPLEEASPPSNPNASGGAAEAAAETTVSSLPPEKRRDILAALFPKQAAAALLANAVGARPEAPWLVARGVIGKGAMASTCVRRQGTCAVAAVKLEVAPPPANAPREGHCVFGVELPPASTGDVWRRNRHPDCRQLSALLTDVLAPCVHTQALLLREGVASFVLYVDVIVLSDDGAVVDAAALAAALALRDVVLPVAAPVGTRWCAGPGAEGRKGAVAGGRRVFASDVADMPLVSTWIVLPSAARNPCTVCRAPTRFEMDHAPDDATFVTVATARGGALICVRTVSGVEGAGLEDGEAFHAENLAIQKAVECREAHERELSDALSPKASG